MGDDSVFVLQFGSSSGNDLILSLSRFSLADDERGLVEWLAKHHAGELEQANESARVDRRLVKVIEAFKRFQESYQVSEAYQAASVSADYLQSMQIALEKLVTIDPRLSHDAPSILAIFHKRQFGELARLLDQLGNSEDRRPLDWLYERYVERLQDGSVLLGELLRVLVAEYNAGAGSLRQELDEHQARIDGAARTTRERLSLIEKAVAEISVDPRLESGDRERLLASFDEKRAELEADRSSQSRTSEALAVVAGTARRALLDFKRFVELLQTQLEGYEARDDYARRLARLDAKVPPFASGIPDMVELLCESSEVVGKAFAMLDATVRSRLFLTLQERPSVRRFVVVASDTMTVELELVLATEGRGELPSEAECMSFLEPIRLGVSSPGERFD